MTAPKALDIMRSQTGANWVVAGVLVVDSDYVVGSLPWTIEKGGWVRGRLVDGKPKCWTELVLKWLLRINVATI